ncbi:MAG: hypothetical protein ABIQ88_20670 [Chitinophagaceae bacterium]
MDNAAIEPTTAITIYRIVQETINNRMKHAAAASALVQKAKENNQLRIPVKNNGIGLDTALLNAAKGMGWNNIRHRVLRPAI